MRSGKKPSVEDRARPIDQHTTEEKEMASAKLGVRKNEEVLRKNKHKKHRT